MKSKHVIPEFKKKNVAELAGLIKDKKTVLIASIKNLPASQFQEIGKNLRGKAIVKVPKKNLISLAIDNSGIEAAKKLKENFKDSNAILFSDLDSFDLAAELLENKTPAKAKAGQEAPKDIEIEAGPTELIPGPAVSELGALGIQIKIDKGKINIEKSKIIAKEGEKISKAAADLMSKLDIKPFSIGFIPLVAFDTKKGKLFPEIKIDREEAIKNIKDIYVKALPFAVSIGHKSKDTIKYLIGKANSHANKINRIITGEPEPKVVATPVKEKVEEKKEVKEEEKAPATEGLGALFG